jgi:hypothetical protein
LIIFLELHNFLNKLGFNKKKKKNISPYTTLDC